MKIWNGPSNLFDIPDIVKDIIFFILTTILAFAYFMLVLLIISFITLSYIHFTIEAIIAIAVACTVIVDIVYVVRKVKQKKR